MTDENEDQTTPDAETPEASSAEPPAGEQPEDKHPLKHGIRQLLGEVAGYAVEVGSILGGEGGDLVKAEKEVTEHNAEEFIDRIDGEG